MPHFFFDIFDDELCRDEEGLECADQRSVREMAMRALPAIAREGIPQDDDRQAFTVLVRDEAGVTVCTATLTFAGLWLGDEIPHAEPSIS